jgi:hypothetical protein
MVEDTRPIHPPLSLVPTEPRATILPSTDRAPLLTGISHQTVVGVISPKRSQQMLL